MTNNTNHAADNRLEHAEQVVALAKALVGNSQPLQVRKKTVSNLFRYAGAESSAKRVVDLSDFNKPLYLDANAAEFEVQGLATFKDITDYLLPHRFASMVTPELKQITIGGALVGIGIETNSGRFGFVHDSLLEAEVLLPDGQVVVARPDNDYSDLFYGLPNSYGTLGYILRAKMSVRRVKPYVQMVTKRYTSTDALVQAMYTAVDDPSLDYIESLIYSKTELYLSLATETEDESAATTIYGSNVFYKDISKEGTMKLPIGEFLFRYDPEWFWAVPETPAYNFLRKVAPENLRSSAFYVRYFNWMEALAAKYPICKSGDDPTLEKLIQDWEVPWKYAADLLNFALENVDLAGKPWLCAPLKTAARATNYPMQSGGLYLNLGSYHFAKIQQGKPAFHNTKIMDNFTFAHDGIKMLYSSTFLTQDQFALHYNGQAYANLKKKYDPKGLASTLYQKAVGRHAK